MYGRSAPEEETVQNIKTPIASVAGVKEILNSNHEGLTVRGTKRIKIFPIKEKTARKRTRNPESWKRRTEQSL